MDFDSISLAYLKRGQRFLTVSLCIPVSKVTHTASSSFHLCGIFANCYTGNKRWDGEESSYKKMTGAKEVTKFF